MKKNRVFLVASVVISALAALFIIKLVFFSQAQPNEAIIGGADGPTAIYVTGKVDNVIGAIASSETGSSELDDAASASEESTEPTTKESQENSTASSEDITTTETTTETEEVSSETITEETTETTATTEATTMPDFSEAGFYKNIQVTDTSKGVLVLCNKNYRLPDDFLPAELVDIPSDYYVHDGKEYKMEKIAAEAFIEMSIAARNEANLDIRVISGYRTQSYQEMLYNHYANNYGKDEADTYSARPRHSEHETGLCCDVNMVDTSFENTPEFEWMMDNAANYGFILRYPKGKEQITGYIYEPWHWRYVGSEVAWSVLQSGLTYDEYYHQNLE